MKKIIIAALVALFALNAAACGGDPTPEAKAKSPGDIARTQGKETSGIGTGPETTPEPDVDDGEALRDEAAAVVADIYMLASKGQKSNDLYKSCNNLLPKMQAKLDLLSDLTEKMDEVDSADVDLAGLRSTQSDLEGGADSISASCDAAGF